MKKFKLFVDMDAEATFLNSMAKSGYTFVKLSWLSIYTFTHDTNSNMEYHIDYRHFNSRGNFVEYITFFEDNGWKHIAGTRNSGKQYFVSEDGKQKELFSDVESKAARYKRLVCNIGFCLALLAIDLMLFLFLSLSQNRHLYTMDLVNGGIWQKRGGDFWFTLVTELPMFLAKYVIPVILVIITVFYFVLSLRTRVIYKKALSGKM